MNAETLALIAGAVLSLLFSYIPGLSTWFETLAPDVKRLFMLGVLLVVTGALFGLSCAGLFAYFACTWAGAWQAVQLFILAAIANQGAYALTPGVHANSR